MMDTQFIISCVVRFPWTGEKKSILCFHNSVFALYFLSSFVSYNSVSVMWVMMMQRLLQETDTQEHESYRKEANFDANMVIILGCLLCALICALGLNSIVRCALRLVYEGGDVRAATGVKKKALKRIPVVVYGEGLEIPASECAICLGEFVNGEKVRVLPQCGHGFHVRCIDVWLGSHSSCPTCRRLVAEVVVGRSLGGGVVAQEGG